MWAIFLSTAAIPQTLEISPKTEISRRNNCIQVVNRRVKRRKFEVTTSFHNIQILKELTGERSNFGFSRSNKTHLYMHLLAQTCWLRRRMMVRGNMVLGLMMFQSSILRDGFSRSISGVISCQSGYPSVFPGFSDLTLMYRWHPQENPMEHHSWGRLHIGTYPSPLQLRSAVRGQRYDVSAAGWSMTFEAWGVDDTSIQRRKPRPRSSGKLLHNYGKWL